MLSNACRMVLLVLATCGGGVVGAAEAPGLIGVWFHEPDFRRPDRVETVDRVDLDTGRAHQAFSLVWLGRLRVPTARPITLQAEADDGLWLRVDGRDTIKGWHDPDRQGVVQAEEGASLPLELRFFQAGGTAFVRLYWSWEGHPRELVPADALSHGADDETRARAIARGAEVVAVPAAGPRPPAAASRPLRWSAGPWLMLDERNILVVDQLRRVVGRPARHGAPVVDGATDGNFQPYLSVVRDEQTGRWRMWYNVPKSPGNAGESHLALIESADGVRWERPHRVLTTPPIQFGASVIDRGPSHPVPSRRFQAGWYKDDGLQVATSPDGVRWDQLAPGPVLRHSHDINAIDWDPIRGRYMAFVSFGLRLDPSWPAVRRIPHMSVSDDLVRWRAPWRIIQPDPASPYERGEAEFYCMAGVIARGELLIGMAKVLRDDVNAEAGLTARDLGDSRPFAGIGYTVLTWSPDGETWRRDTEPFFDRNPTPGAWDRAHAWIDEQVAHGDEVYLYYAGYRLGHKADRFASRQIGLARLPLDRYAGFTNASDAPGGLRTPVRPWEGGRLVLNADVRGKVRVAVCDANGRFVPGFGFDDCRPVVGNGIALPVAWNDADLSSLRGRPVQLAFALDRATLYAFSITPP